MANKTKIQDAVAGLDRVFHNEKDFQIAFCRQLEESGTGPIRPEFPVDYTTGNGETRTYLDVAHLPEGPKTAIELKYPFTTFRASEPIYGLNEVFRQKRIQAYDVPMYEFWKDVSTLEALIETGGIDSGFVLSLSNYEGCWDKRGQHLNAADFLMYEGREVSGEELSYSDEASPKTREDYPPLRISGTYEISWVSYEYSHPLEASGNTAFQYTLVEVDPDS